MLRYYQTTTLILMWCLILSLAWGFFIYHRRMRRPTPVPTGAAWSSGGRMLILPGLALAPLVLVIGFRVFGINLLFPVHFFSDLNTLIMAALLPAAVLIVVSGLGIGIKEAIHRELSYWQGKTFVLMTQVVGRPQKDALRRLVLLKALATAWGQSLPWIFGELIVIEAVFNAPGLGLDAWHMARIRDEIGLAQAIVSLVALYSLCTLISALVHRWIGRRLETYS